MGFRPISNLQWSKTNHHQNGNVNRKTRKNHNTKITHKIEKFVREYVRKYNTLVETSYHNVQMCIK